MEPNSPEQEKSKIEIIKLNQEFPLFTSHLVKMARNTNRDSFRSQSLLAIDTLPKFPFLINASASKTLKENAIVPFNKELGYQITTEDFDVETRKEKIKKIETHGPSEAIFQQAPLQFYIYTLLGTLEDAGISTKIDMFRYELTSSSQAFFNKLRFQVTVNGLCLEAEPNSHDLNEGRLRFDHYYPIDTGPLAASEFQLHEGLSLFLPSDLDTLQTMKGKFTLLPEKKSAMDDPGVFGNMNMQE